MTDIVALAARYAQLNELKTNVEQQLSEVKEQIRALGVGDYDAGALHVTVRPPNRKFNLLAAEKRFDQEEYPQFWMFVLDAKKVKESLSEDDLDTLMAPGDGEPVVVVK